MPRFVGADLEPWCHIFSGADLENHHGKAVWAYGLTSQLFKGLHILQDKGTEAVLDPTDLILVKLQLIPQAWSMLFSTVSFPLSPPCLLSSALAFQR